MRGSAPWLLLLLVAAPARADLAGKKVGVGGLDGVAINGCSPEEKEQIKAGLAAAADLAADCLKNGLAPDVGEKVLGMFAKGKLRMFCDGENNDDQANASTTFPKHKATIAVYSKTMGKANDMSPQGLGEKLLHELIHAADEPNALIADMTLHNKGYPDRVYACHLACTGGDPGEGMKARLALLMHAYGQRLEPSGAAVRCPASGGCGPVKLLATMCGPAGNAWVAFERKEAARFEQVNCLMREVAAGDSCKADVCADIKRQVAAASAKGPPPASLLGALMIHFYDVAKASSSKEAREALADRDAALLEAVEDAGVLRTCKPVKADGGAR